MQPLERVTHQMPIHLIELVIERDTLKSAIVANLCVKQ